MGVGFGEAVGHPGLVCEPLSDVRASRVLLPAGHPLASRAPLRFRDLAELPLLFFPREVNPPLHDRVLAALGERGLVPTLRTGIHSQLAREAAVRAGHGWMLAADAMPETPGGLEVREVDDPPIGAALNPVVAGGRDGARGARPGGDRPRRKGARRRRVSGGRSAA